MLQPMDEMFGLEGKTPRGIKDRLLRTAGPKVAQLMTPSLLLVAWLPLLWPAGRC